MPKGKGQADGAAPVVEYEREVCKVEMANERFDASSVSRRAVGTVGRGIGTTEPEVVGRDASVVRGKAANEVTIEMRAGGVAVEQKDRRSVANIGIGHGAGGRAKGVRLEGGRKHRHQGRSRRNGGTTMAERREDRIQRIPVYTG